MTSDDENRTIPPQEEDIAVNAAAPQGEAMPEEESQESLIDAFTAGGRLKGAREAKGRTIESMSAELHINWRVLESLEKTIQPPDYDMRRTRIVARSYAKALGIDPEPVLADFPMEEEKDLATAIPKSSVTVSERKKRSYLIPASVVASAVVAIGVSAIVLTPDDPSRGRSVPSVAERVVAVNTAQESLFASQKLDTADTRPVDLAIVATRPAWIEVRGADGTIFRSRTMARHEAYFPRIGAGWTVTVQEGDAFEWQLDGVSVGALAEEAIPLYSASIDEAAVFAREQAAPAMAATSNSRPAR